MSFDKHWDKHAISSNCCESEARMHYDSAWNEQQKKIDAVLRYVGSFNHSDIKHDTMVNSIIYEIKELLK